MKAKYNSLVQIAVALLFTLFIAACSTDTSYEEALEENRQEIEDPKTLEDANFMVEARSLSILATRISALASDSGYSSALVSFATAHSEDYDEMEKDLKALARKKNLTLPTEMSEEHKALFYELSAAPRKEFDQKFIALAKRINGENKALYTRNATSANDPDIRAFAARKMGQLEANLKEVGEIEEQLLETVDRNQ